MKWYKINTENKIQYICELELILSSIKLFAACDLELV